MGLWGVIVVALLGVEGVEGSGAGIESFTEETSAAAASVLLVVDAVDAVPGRAPGVGGAAAVAVAVVAGGATGAGIASAPGLKTGALALNEKEKTLAFGFSGLALGFSVEAGAPAGFFSAEAVADAGNVDVPEVEVEVVGSLAVEVVAVDSAEDCLVLSVAAVSVEGARGDSADTDATAVVAAGDGDDLPPRPVQ